MKRDEDGEWLRLEQRPDLALEEDAPEPPRRRPRPAPGKITRTLALPAASPAAKAQAAAPQEPAPPTPAAHADPFPDVFGGALSPPPAVATQPVAAAAAQGGGELAAAKAAVDRAFAAQRDAILAAAAEQGPALQQAAAAAHTLVIGDIASRETTIRATFAQARDAVRNAERVQIALAHSDAATVARRLRSATSVRKPCSDAADVQADRVTSTIHADGALITGSANVVYSKIASAHDDALHDADLPLKDTQAVEILDALRTVRDATRKEVQRWVTRDWTTLLQTGLRRATALRKSAEQLADEMAAPLADAADDVTSAGDLLASAISQGAEQQIASLASAERTILAGLARERVQAASVVRVGQIAGMRLRQDAAAKVGALGGPQAAAHRALDTVAPAGPGAVAEMRDYAVAAAGDAGRDIIQTTRSAPSALAAVVGERRTLLNGQIDQRLSTVLQEVGPAAARFTSECAAHRAQAVQDYSAGETQMSTQVLAALGPAINTWRTDAEQFVALAGKFTSLVLQQHRAYESGLDAAFVRFARDEFTRTLRTRAERAWDVAAGGVHSLGHGVANFAVGTAKYAAIVVAAPLIPLGTLAAGAYTLYNIYEGAERRVDALRSTWHQRSTLGKVVAIYETSAAIWGDQTGITSMVEGVLHREAITHRALPNDEAGAKYSEGAMMLVAGAVLERHAGGAHGELTAGAESPQLPGGRPRGHLPEGAQAPRQLQPGASAGDAAPSGTGSAASRGGAHGEVTTSEAPHRRGGRSLADEPAAEQPTPPAASTPEPTRPVETPPQPVVPDPKAERIAEELTKNLESRGIANDPMFENLPVQTQDKVTKALKDDPMGKVPATQRAAIEWAREQAGGNAREFANHYEYAKAYFLDVREGLEPAFKGKPDSKAKLAEAAAAEATPQKLGEVLEQDAGKIRERGPGQHLEPLALDAIPAEVAARVQKLDHIGFESESAEAYHARKHRNEVPESARTGDRIRDYRNVATDTIKNGEVAMADPVDGGKVRVVIRKSYVHPGTLPKTLEAIIYVSPDGTVTLATFGERKMKQ